MLLYEAKEAVINMKELKYGESLNVVNVFRNITLPNNNIELEKVRQIVFSDGYIDIESEEETINIDKFFICNRAYEFDVDTLKTRKVSFKEYSYIITFYIAEMKVHNRNLCGIADQIFGPQIYLANRKDLAALRKARNKVKEIDELFNIKRDFTVSSREPIISNCKQKVRQLGKNIYNIK